MGIGNSKWNVYVNISVKITGYDSLVAEYIKYICSREFILLLTHQSGFQSVAVPSRCRKRYVLK